MILQNRQHGGEKGKENGQEPTFSKLLRESKRVGSQVDSGPGIVGGMELGMKMGAGMGIGLPKVERNLDALGQETRKLATRSVAETGPMDSRTQAFFEEGGVDAKKLFQKVHTINIEKAFEDTASGMVVDSMVAESNVERYLRGYEEFSVLRAIENSQNKVLEELEDKFRAASQIDWEQTKQKLLEGQGIGFGQEKAGARMVERLVKAMEVNEERSRESSKFVGVGVEGEAENKVGEYGQIIKRVNIARVKETRDRIVSGSGRVDLKLIELLREVASKGETERYSQHLKECYEMVERFSTVSKEIKESKGGKGDKRGGKEYRQAMVNKTREYLERLYLEHIERVIEKYPREAAVGGVPSIYNKIKGYLQVKFRRSQAIPEFLEVYEGEAVWANMYYLLRCGKVREMLEYAIGLADVVADSDPEFLRYLRSYVESETGESGGVRAVSAVEREKIAAAVNMMRMSSVGLIDPYKYIIYKIIGRSDLGRKTVPEVITSTEDYLWLQLQLTREIEGDGKEGGRMELGMEKYTLGDLKAMITKFGDRHFDPSGQNPLVYFKILIMTQQFEKGISYLLQQRERDTQDYYLVDAVHFAIILGYNGLLNIAQDEYNYGHNYEYFLESELDYYLVGKSKVDEPKCVKLNFNKLILDYAMALHRFYENKAKMDKKFNHVHSVGLGANDYTPMMGPVATELTMHYILLLSLPSLTDNNTKEAQTQQQQLDVCIRAINKYLYESSDFQYYQYYLGDILKDGTQQKGLLQRYRQLLGLSNKEQFDAAITQKLASKNIEEGKLTEGIMLYNLSEQYETVLHILTNKLGNELYRMLSAQHNEGMASAQDYNSTQFQLMCKSPQYLEYYELTQTVLQYYFKSSIDKTFKQPATVLSGLLLLVEFARFVSAYSGGNYEQGLEIIAGCSILPTFSSTTNLASAPDTIRISSMADSLVRTYDDYVLRLVPHIMLLTMRCLVSLYARYKSPQLKTMANNLVVFSGLSQLKMNSSVFAELGRMNSLLL